MFREGGTDAFRSQFASHRYIKVEGLIDAGLQSMLYKYVMRRADVAKPAFMKGQDGAVEMFADQVMEHVLAGVQTRIEELSGLTLDPTYSFFRVYRRGNVLERHLDRPSCEVSVSLNLGPALDPPWPLWMKGPLSESALALAPGDAALYRGIECHHWREPLEGDHLALVFLHYIERDGRYSDWKYDKRPGLGT
jgi:hypothetical protein